MWFAHTNTHTYLLHIRYCVSKNAFIVVWCAVSTCVLALFVIALNNIIEIKSTIKKKQSNQRPPHACLHCLQPLSQQYFFIKYY